MKTLAVLGATGSIGRNTLQIVSKFPDRFKIKALAAKTNVTLLADQIRAFRPEVAVVYDSQAACELKSLLSGGQRVEILCGPQGYSDAARLDGVTMVVAAMVGAAGLAPVLAAIEAGKDVGLANKETLVMAGGVVMEAVVRKKIRLMPIDSEHSAIFQCLQGHRRQDLDKIILTASGGPLLRTPAEQFDHIGPEQALRHPNWRMGAKISIDSATLMNKGLEVIEAKWLFDLHPKQIQVLVHPQSIVHSMVAYRDGSLIAQMGIPDMQAAIAYALSFPERLPLGQPIPDLALLQALTFEPPDTQRFGCLSLALDACCTGGTQPAVLNAANEVAVYAFLSGRLAFSAISGIVGAAMAAHIVEPEPDLETILAADAWARQWAQRMVEESGTIVYNRS